MKNRIISLLLTGFMLLGLLPGGVMDAAAQEKTAVTVTAGFQAEGQYITAPQKLQVSAGLAGEYGYQYDAEVTDEDVTALDVLVALHQVAFGSDFTPEDAGEYLAVSTGGYVTKLYGMETGNNGFAVNGAQPHSDVWNPGSGGYPGYYNGYALNRSMVYEGDLTEFFLYQDSYAMDLYAWFGVDGERVDSLNAAVGEPLNLTLQGYMMGWYGCSDEQTITDQTEPIEGAELYLSDANGNMQSLSIDTDENGDATVSFDTTGTYYVTAVGDEYEPIIMPWLAVTVREPAQYPIYENKVYEDFENDLWLQYDFKEMEIGDTAVIYPRRVPQAADGGNQVVRPVFHFDVVEGNSVTLDTAESTDRATVTAKRAGDTVVMVTYEAMTVGTNTYGACSPVNTGYVVFSVKDSGAAGITISTDIPYTLYDTVYFADGDSTEMRFHVTTGGAQQVQVACNGKTLQEGQDGYTARLSNRANLISVHASDGAGHARSYYRVVDARKIELLIANKTNPGSTLKAGDTATVSFKGITMPVYKLAGIYNPTMSSFSENKSTFVSYQSGGRSYQGVCTQYDLAACNSFDVSLPAAGTVSFSDGHIESEWWGDELGSDQTVMGQGAPNLNAPVHSGSFSQMPDFSITVASSGNSGSSGGSGTTVSNTVSISVDGTTAQAGTMLGTTKIALQSGDTVWSVTKRILEGKNIPFTAVINATTGDVYLSEINGLQELAHGSGSGWMFSVNGTFVQQSCNTVTLRAGDVLMWRYTCDYGNDLVASTGGSSSGGSATGGISESKPVASGVYTDVPADAWYYDAVNAVTEKGLMQGISASEFAPDAPLTRGMMAVILYRINKGEPIKAAKNFADVEEHAWYADAVLWAAEQGMMLGYDDTHFGPDDPLTREQLAVVLARTEKAEGQQDEETVLSGFSDRNQISAWAVKGVCICVENKRMTGVTDTEFAPLQIATRGQLAQILAK